MSVKKETILRALEKLRQVSKKRNFAQTVDFTVSFKGLDFKKPESKIEVGVKLPHGVGKQGESKVLVFASDADFAKGISAKVSRVIMVDEVSRLSKNDVEKLLSEYNTFFAEGPAMLAVGRHLGQQLAPRGRMPRLITNSVNAFEQEMKSTSGEIKVSNKKGKAMPLVHVVVGKENDQNERLAENIVAVYDALVQALPAKEQNISYSMVKLTMSPPVKIGEKEQAKGSEKK